MLYIETEKISEEIQNILAKHNVTIDLIDDVLEKSSLYIKSRTAIKETPVTKTIKLNLDGKNITDTLYHDLKKNK